MEYKTPFMSIGTKKIYVIDDDESIGMSLKLIASTIGYHSEYLGNMNRIRDFVFHEEDLLFIDIYMPDLDGIEFLRHLSNQNIRSKIFLMSGFDSKLLYGAESIAKAYGLNVLGIITKPFQLSEFLNAIKDSENYQPHKKGAVNEIFFTKDELIHGVEKDEMFLLYQPKIDLKTNQTIGFEALIRWKHPNKGVINPDNFISFAENNDYIHEITLYVIHKSLRLAKDLFKSGYKFKLAINMSASEFNDLGLPDALAKILETYRIDPSQIIIEVTETNIFNDLAKSMDTLLRLRMKGFHISIDDFGTGYSTFQQLKRVPFSELKIDRLFILDCLSNPDSAAIIKSTIDLAHKLGIQVVAEGIENEQIKQFLIDNNCDIGQGFYFSKPLYPNEILKWFKA